MNLGLWLLIIWLVISGTAGLIGATEDTDVGLALFALVGLFDGIVLLLIWAIVTSSL